MRFSHVPLAALAVLLAACASPSPNENDEAASPEDVGEAAQAVLVSDGPGIHGALVPRSNKHDEALYQLGAKGWLTWAMALPWSTGPITDATGAACAQGQSGSVWYLAGTTGGDVQRACSIPKNKALFFPLVDNWVIGSADQVATPEDFASYVAFEQEYLPSLRAQTCELHLALDGVAIGGATTASLDQKLWTQVTNPFTVTIDADNFASQWGFPGGTTPAAAIAGHFALVTPLAKGHHVLSFGGSMCDETNAVVFANSAVYDLTVE